MLFPEKAADCKAAGMSCDLLYPFEAKTVGSPKNCETQYIEVICERGELRLLCKRRKNTLSLVGIQREGLDVTLW